MDLLRGVVVNESLTLEREGLIPSFSSEKPELLDFLRVRIPLTDRSLGGGSNSEIFSEKQNNLLWALFVENCLVSYESGLEVWIPRASAAGDERCVVPAKWLPPGQSKRTSDHRSAQSTHLGP